MSITVSQLRDERRRLEDELHAFITQKTVEFEKLTGVPVENISLEFSTVNCHPSGFVYHLNAVRVALDLNTAPRHL